MPDALPIDSDLARTVACAASVGRHPVKTIRTVRRALELGLEAARHNRTLPLPLLLDAVGLLDGLRPGMGRVRRGISVPPIIGQYDRWLGGLRGVIQQGGLRAAAQADGDAVCHLVPLLTQLWPTEGPEPGHSSDQWAERCRTIGDEEALSLFKHWSGDRMCDAQVWNDWCPSELKFMASRVVLLLSRFGPPSGPNSRRFAVGPIECLDAGAGHLYLHSHDAVLLPDQARVIERLRQCRQAMQSYPLTDAVEEQDPFFGVISLAALLADDIDQLARDIQTKPRLNSLPRARPPRGVHIHLCWSTGFPALGGRASIREEQTEGVSPPLSHAAFLQALMALVVDDWRCFLHPLPIQFHLHRGCPLPIAVAAGGTGLRWKDFDANESPLPPPDVTRLLFRRATHAELAGTPLDWRAPDSPHPTALPHSSLASWWCMALLKSDLKALGAPAHEPALNPTSGLRWKIAGEILPSNCTHVVVVDPEADDGQLCVVRRRHGTSETELLVLPRRRRGPPCVPFANLRADLVDLLLQQLTQRL